MTDEQNRRPVPPGHCPGPGSASTVGPRRGDELPVLDRAGDPAYGAGHGTDPTGNRYSRALATPGALDLNQLAGLSVSVYLELDADGASADRAGAQHRRGVRPAHQVWPLHASTEATASSPTSAVACSSARGSRWR